MRPFVLGWLLFSVLLLLPGCGGKTPANVKFLVASSAAREGGAAAARVPADGTWRLTPDQAKVTITKFGLVADGGTTSESDPVSCELTADASQRAGTELLNCPVNLPTGKYVGVTVFGKTSVQLKLSDATNGIYTSPSATNGFATARANGDFATITYNPTSDASATEFAAETLLPAEFEVGEATTLYIATDLVHTIQATIASGVVSEVNYLGGPVILVPSTAATVSGQVYSTLASAGNARITDVPNFYELRVFNSDATTATRVLSSGSMPACVSGNYYYEAMNTSPSKSPAKSDGSKLGGYLGGVGDMLAWAFAATNKWETYTSLYQMTRKTALGQTTTIDCQTTTSPQVPTDSTTYASGLPTVTPTASRTLTLIAK